MEIGGYSSNSVRLTQPTGRCRGSTRWRWGSMARFIFVVLMLARLAPIGFFILRNAAFLADRVRRLLLPNKVPPSFNAAGGTDPIAFLVVSRHYPSRSRNSIR